jgi:hypothetical protein
MAKALGGTLRRDAKMAAYAKNLRFKRDPLAGKFRAEVLAHKAKLQRHLEDCETALRVAAGVLLELP